MCQSNANIYPQSRIAGKLEVYPNLGITDRVVRINILFLKINETLLINSILSRKLYNYQHIVLLHRIYLTTKLWYFGTTGLI